MLAMDESETDEDAECASRPLPLPSRPETEPETLTALPDHWPPFVSLSLPLEDTARRGMHRKGTVVRPFTFAPLPVDKADSSRRVEAAYNATV